jgi:hypothetical protein
VAVSEQDLGGFTADIEKLTKRLETSRTGSNKAALIDTEAPFTDQENNYQNERPTVKECVERVLTQRRNALAVRDGAIILFQWSPQSSEPSENDFSVLIGSVITYAACISNNPLK